MKSRISIVLTTLVVFMLGATAGLDAQTPLPPPACNIAGTWVGSTPAIPPLYTVPGLATMSVTPTDPSGQRFTAVIQPVNGDPTFVGLFPDADGFADLVGTYVRSGPQTFLATWVVYFFKLPPAGSFDRPQVLYSWFLSGTAECVDANTQQLTAVISLYSNVDRPDLVAPPLGVYGVHDQDTDDDGFPDEGEAPFVVVPFDLTFKRLPVMTTPAP